jgi:dTDP-4-dehydrorhamnose reductase
LETVGIPYKVYPREDLDYTGLMEFTNLLKEMRPEFLINCAGYTGKPNVDACELHKSECVFGNVVLPGIISTACERAGVPWGHVSSGCIYNGAKPDGSGFKETDPPNFSFRSPPCSFYSGTKALGEEVLADDPRCFIWRLRIPFNEVDSARNYISKVMRYDRLLDARNSLSQLEEFVRAAVACWTQRVPFGVYNMTNPGCITTREIVGMIQKSGVCRKEFNFFADEAEFMRIAAKTPRSNCVLDVTKREQAGIHMTEVYEAVATALRNWKAA